MPRDAPLPAFLERAFDLESLGAAITEKMLTSRQRLAALVPQRGHLAKDGSLVVSYRAEVTDGHPAGPTAVPLYLHTTALAASGEKRRQRSQSITVESRLVPGLRRNFARLDRDTFLTAFPRDPELRQIAKLLRPGNAIAVHNRDLRLAGEPEATALTLSLLSHRPGRRAVFAGRVIESTGEESTLLLKLCRPHAAKRMWETSRRLQTICSQGECPVAWPVSLSDGTSLVRFPFIPGTTLHALLERGDASERQVKAAGKLLRGFHSGGQTQGASRMVPPFTLQDEVEMLERWRRLLSVGEHPHHGQMAGQQSVLADWDSRDVGPATLIHRDFYPKQVILAPHTDRITLIDIDTVAWGPAAMDVGNFLAHLWLHRFDGASRERVKAWRRAFLRGYGRDALDARVVALFEFASLTRLGCLAAVSPGASERVPALLREARRLLRGPLA